MSAETLRRAAAKVRADVAAAASEAGAEPDPFLLTLADIFDEVAEQDDTMEALYAKHFNRERPDWAVQTLELKLARIYLAQDATASPAGRAIEPTIGIRPDCPTCTWPNRETVNMVCPTCGFDYGGMQ